MFQKAIKSESKLRLAITGPSGAGKTYTALTIASEFGKVALVDTEHGSASKYADRIPFDDVKVTAPFNPLRIINMIDEAVSGGYDVLIIDSLTHFWTGSGGLLDMVDDFGKAVRGNTFAGWKQGTPIQNQLVEHIIACPIHIIATMRSKTEYVLTSNEKGKQTPVKLGMAPIQRDGIEYEFDLVLDMDYENNAVVSKTRLFSLPLGTLFRKPSGDVAQLIKAELSGQPDDRPRYADRSLVADAGRDIFDQFKAAHLGRIPASRDEMAAWYKAQKDGQAPTPPPAPEQGTAGDVDGVAGDESDAPDVDQPEDDNHPLASEVHKLALATKASPNVGDVIAALSNDGRAKPDYSRETIKAEWEPITGKSITPATKVTVETALKMYEHVVGSMF